MHKYKIKEVFRTPNTSGHFFGYFDKSQLSYDKRRLLVHKIRNWDKYPEKKETFQIGYYKIHDKNKNFYQIGETNCINFQMGCNLQWINKKCNEVIYNKLFNNQYVSIRKKIKNKIEKIITPAIYCIDKSGKYGLAINFNRHDVIRPGYSYRHEKNHSNHIPIDKKDWIKLVNLNTGKSKIILSMDDLLELNPVSSMEESFHYLEHLSFSPNGETIIFFHRWKSLENQIYSRVYSYNLRKKTLKSILDSGRGSHYCWLNDEEILIYGGEKNILNIARSNRKIAKFFFKPILPIYHYFIRDNSYISKNLTGDSYWKINVKNGNMEKVLNSLGLEDGHPTFNGKFVITDTYSAKKNCHKASLFLVSGDLKKDLVLDQLVISGDKNLDESPFRCDLHPRFCYDTNYFTVDAFDKGNRVSIVFEISKF